jgi:S1-C subfamily serine protease
MRARLSKAAAVAATLAALLSPAAPAAGQSASSPWRIAAEDGVCTVVYSADGLAAQGFSWAPDGRLAWLLLQKGGSKRPVALEVRTAIGETYSGAAEPDDEAGYRSYAYVDSDRRNGRLILSGDLEFSYQMDGRRRDVVLAAGVQAPRIAACMDQARDQAAHGQTARQGPEEAPPPDDGQPRVIATGSGVFVDGKGDLITNAHVVEGCRAVGSEGLGAAEIVAVDRASDLALLRFKGRSGAYARLRENVRLGEPVTAAGYPLQDILGNGLNITTGNISALAGIGGDRRQLQISAPVQPGNSGGALLDANGRLVGVVVARLKHEAGDPENINFAVAPYVVGAFLRENGVALPEPAAPVKDVAQLAREFTILLECVG